MRATTPRKKAMRTLRHAGDYLAKSRHGMKCDVQALVWALNLIVTRYHDIRGATTHGKPLQRTA